MRIDLAHLDASGLALTLPTPANSALKREVAIRGATGLHGTLTVLPGGFQLEKVGCDTLVLDGLTLQFETVRVELKNAGELRELGASLRYTDGALDLTVHAGTLRAGRLSLQVGALSVEAALEGSALSLALHGSAGALHARAGSFHGIALRTTGQQLESETLSLRELSVEWGPGGVRVVASGAAVPALKARGEGLAVSARELTLEGLEVHDGDLEVARVQLAEVAVDASLVRPDARVDNPEQPPSPDDEADTARAVRLFDYALLDGLFGHLNVDVFVDAQVPIYGRRRATHALRVKIDQGTIDYRALEQNLATLEDSLLDFSVRDRALVLELGIPLLSTRGRGKPLLVWELGEADLALALSRRVRLAVLPLVRPAQRTSSAPPERNGGSSPVTLRTLAFLDVDADLALKPPSTALGSALRRVAWKQLKLGGAIQHEPAEASAPEGALHGSVEGLEATLAGLGIGTQTLAAALQLGALRQLELFFLGLRPTRVKGVLERLTVDDLRLS